MEQIYLIQKDGLLWGVQQDKTLLAVCMFSYLEEAEVYLINWGVDPESYEYLRFKGLGEVLKGFEKVARVSEWATFDSPTKGKKFNPFKVQPVIDKIKQHIYHPYS